MAPLQFSARVGDPVVETIARSVHALFPNCVRCGQKVGRFEDADVRILVARVTHKGECPVTGEDATRA